MILDQELTKLVSHRYKIDDAAEAFELARTGKCMKVMFEI